MSGGTSFRTAHSEIGASVTLPANERVGGRADEVNERCGRPRPFVAPDFLLRAPVYVRDLAPPAQTGGVGVMVRATRRP
jgi:hypothetical protein